MDVPPVLTVLTQAAMVLAFGVIRLFVAVPLLVLVMLLVKMLYVEDVLGSSTTVPSEARAEERNANAAHEAHEDTG